jgi:hypothetical protein
MFYLRAIFFMTGEFSRSGRRICVEFALNFKKRRVFVMRTALHFA